MYIGNQDSPPFLREIIQKEGSQSFDLIIDDGGHSYDQQQISYAVLFPEALKPGGCALSPGIFPFVSSRTAPPSPVSHKTSVPVLLLSIPSLTDFKSLLRSSPC